MNIYTLKSDNFILVKYPESEYPRLLYYAVPQMGSEIYEVLWKAKSGELELYIESMKTTVKREFNYYMWTFINDDDDFMKILKFIDPGRKYATPVKVFYFTGLIPDANVKIYAMFPIPDA